MQSTDLYEGKPSGYFGNARPEMLAFVPATAARLLDVGCGAGEFGAAVKCARDVHVTGIEPHRASAGLAEGRIDRVLAMSVEEGIRELPPAWFDCIVFNDVLEHVVDPEAILRSARALLRPGGVVIASIPNMRFWPVLRALVVDGQWRYADDGVMDRTHLRFFTIKSIGDTFVRCGYRLRTLQGINSKAFTWKFRVLELASGGALADARHQQIAAVAEPA